MKNILIIIIAISSAFVHGQQVEQSSLYMFNGLYYNPAYAGSRNTLNATFIAREQWVGLNGGPSSQFFSIHTPLKSQSVGVGLHANNDNIGSRNKTSVYGDFNGSIKLNRKNDRINVGLSIGVDNFSYSFSNLIAYDPNDPLVTADYSLIKPNVGAGVYYFGDRHYVGISSPMVVEWEDELNGINSEITRRHYFISAGYVFEINSVLDLKPSTLVKVVPGAPITFDLNASLLAYKKFWAGLMYRYNEGLGVNMAFVMKDRFTIGYAYDYPINELRTYQYGSHELMLQFDFSRYKKQGKTYSPRYF